MAPVAFKRKKVFAERVLHGNEGTFLRRTLIILSIVLMLSLSFSPFCVRRAYAQSSTITLYPTDAASIDSSYPNNNWPASSYHLFPLSYSYFFSSRTVQSWLKFDLSGIPAGATITSAILSLNLVYTTVDQNIGVYGESSNSWAEGSITWNNAPRGSVSSSYSWYNYVTNGTSYYSWNVQSLVAGASLVSLVLQPTTSQSQNINGWSNFYGSGSSGPSLTITYSYTPAPSEVQLAISQNTVSLGGSVILTANITPTTASDGTVTIQYSSDGVNWGTLSSGTPTSGTFSYVWSPESVGTYYLRATWTGDSYYQGSTSNEQTLVVQQIQTSISLSAPSTSSLDQSITITAVLRDSTGNPISGAQILFELGSSTIGAAYTGADGSATLGFALTVSAGAYQITASYAGSAQYAPSSAQSQISVIPWTLTISTTIPDASLVTFNGQSYSSDSSGEITIHVDSTGTYSLNVVSPVETSAGTRVVFVQWGDGSSASTRSVYISSDMSLSIVTKVQYKLTIQSPFGSPTGGNWYDSGSNAVFTILSPVDQQNGTRRVFVAWTANSQPSASPANGSLAMTGPVTLQASWKVQYFVAASTSVASVDGSGWYDKGSTATIKVSPTTTGFLILQVFNGWAEGVPNQGGVSTFVVNGPVSLHATWRTDYTQLILVLVVAGGGGAGGLFLVRRRRAPTSGQEWTPPPEQKPTESESQTVVERPSTPESGTSVYAAAACPQCGTLNPVGAVYCGSCGADLKTQ